MKTSIQQGHGEVKGVPDATLRFLLGVDATADVTPARNAFEQFAASRTGDWRRLWTEFEQQWKSGIKHPASQLATDTPTTRAALARLRNFGK